MTKTVVARVVPANDGGAMRHAAAVQVGAEQSGPEPDLSTRIERTGTHGFVASCDTGVTSAWTSVQGLKHPKTLAR